MTQEYRNRINEIADGIKHEPEMRKMRDDISEGIKSTGNRQADVEEQFQEVIENTTDKDVVSAPEIIAARNGEANLKSRLDKENQEVTAQLAQNMTYVTPEMSTQEIQNIIDSYQNITFKKGDYNLEFTKYVGSESGQGNRGLSGICLDIPDNRRIIFEKGVVLNIPTNDLDNYVCINVDTVDNVTFIGELKIIGDRKTHEGSTGEWGHGLFIRGGKNIRIEYVEANDCWGDGVCIARSGYTDKDFRWYSEDIHIDTIITDNNRRQGVSVTSVKGLYGRHWELKNTTGTPPAAGIDLEPNQPLEKIEGVRIDSIYTENNAYGITMNFSRFNGEGVPGGKNYVDVVIRNHESVGDRESFLVQNPGSMDDGKNTVYGKIVIEYPIWKKSTARTCSIANWYVADLNLTIVHPQIIDGNTAEGSNVTNYSAFSIWTQDRNTNRKVGNITIIEPDIKIIDGFSAPRAFNFSNNNDSKPSFEKIHIIDPKNNLNESFMAIGDGGVIVSDGYRILENELTSQTFSANLFYSSLYIASKGTTNNVRINLNDTLTTQSLPLTFENRSDEYEMSVVPPSDTSIIPLKEAGQPLFLPKGTRITIQKVDEVTYQVVSMVGELIR